MKNSKLNLNVILIAAGLVACAAPKSTVKEIVKDTNLQVAGLNTQSRLPAGDGEGASSGGGGYVSENSRLVLNQAKDSLAKMIRQSTPNIYKNLPKNWTQEKMAVVVENIKLNPDTTLYRDGKELMFNYKTSEQGTPYLEVLSQFFRVYAATPIKFQSDDNLYIIKDVQLKIAHELGHFFVGGDDDKAEAFGLQLLHVLQTDIVSCKNAIETEKPFDNNTFVLADKSYFVTHSLPKYINIASEVYELLFPFSFGSKYDDCIKQDEESLRRCKAVWRDSYFFMSFEKNTNNTSNQKSRAYKFEVDNHPTQPSCRPEAYDYIYNMETIFTKSKEKLMVGVVIDDVNQKQIKVKISFKGALQGFVLFHRKERNEINAATTDAIAVDYFRQCSIAVTSAGVVGEFAVDLGYINSSKEITCDHYYEVLEFNN